jgi:phage portal protein BeeE
MSVATILEGGLKWQALDLTTVDTRFIESRSFELSDVLRAFGLPPHKLAIEGDLCGIGA